MTMRAEGALFFIPIREVYQAISHLAPPGMIPRPSAIIPKPCFAGLGVISKFNLVLKAQRIGEKTAHPRCALG